MITNEAHLLQTFAKAVECGPVTAERYLRGLVHYQHGRRKELSCQSTTSESRVGEHAERAENDA